MSGPVLMLALTLQRVALNNVWLARRFPFTPLRTGAHQEGAAHVDGFS